MDRFIQNQLRPYQNIKKTDSQRKATVDVCSLCVQVMRAAEILEVDLLEESFLVPVLKTLLSSLSNAFNQGHLEEDICVFTGYCVFHGSWLNATKGMCGASYVCVLYIT